MHEGRIGGKGELAGLDAKVAVNDHTSIRGEIAATKTESGASSTDGSAYLAEIVHRSTTIEGKAYVREQESGFGLGQQNAVETGTRKFGFDGAYRFSTAASIRSELFRQHNLSTDAVRDVAQVQGAYAQNRSEFGAGVRRGVGTVGHALA